MTYSGEELSLRAQEKELKRLDSKVSRIQKEVEECMHIASEIIDINIEFARIVNSECKSGEKLKDLDELKKRSNKAEKIRKKDLCKLFEKETHALLERDALKREVETNRFRLRARSGIRFKNAGN